MKWGGGLLEDPWKQITSGALSAEVSHDICKTGTICDYTHDM